MIDGGCLANPLIILIISDTKKVFPQIEGPDTKSLKFSFNLISYFSLDPSLIPKSSFEGNTTPLLHLALSTF